MIVGRQLSGADYLLNIEKFFRRFFKKITKSSEQYNDGINGDEETKEMSEFDGGIVVFDYELDYNQKPIDPFFTKGGYKNWNVYFLPQSLPDQPIRTTGETVNYLIC